MLSDKPKSDKHNNDPQKHIHCANTLLSLDFGLADIARANAFETTPSILFRTIVSQIATATRNGCCEVDLVGN